MAGSCPGNYSLVRIWLAADNCGNQISHTQTISVLDTQVPSWNQSMPADLTVECDAIPTAPTGLTASDLCDTDVFVSLDEDRIDGNCSDNYALVRTWTATDDCGNLTSYTQTITVRDTQAP
ncbi:MAG: hypothetical protein ACO3US_07050, partial [Ilumatobacteraceae bacterium]